MLKQIPNIVTLLNLFFGCMAIVAAVQPGLTIITGSDGEQLVALPEKIWLAAIFIGIAAVIDFLDGFVARLMNASSEMGKQLDSLADVVSFGVAPAMIAYQFLRLSYAQQEDGLDISMGYLIPVFILPCAAAYRLGRFNLDTTQQFGFKGLPVPAAGLMIASFPLIYWFSGSTALVALFLNKWLWYGVILLLSGLMVSTLPLMAFKFKDYTVANNWPKYLVVLIAILGGIFLQWLAIPLVIIAYVVLSLALKQA
ncbi:MAG: CDP-alcohol phosphatidyltransferase family protein [Chitinophagaceae bacterium]